MPEAKRSGASNDCRAGNCDESHCGMSNALSRDEDEFELHYQTIVDVQSRAVFAVASVETARTVSERFSRSGVWNSMVWPTDNRSTPLRPN
jgi:hypothetical protein